MRRRSACAFVCNAAPVRLSGEGRVEAAVFAYTQANGAGVVGTGETFELCADQVFLAIGQTLAGLPQGLTLERGKIKVSGAGRTGIAGIWAGGDCTPGGEDLTVTAVAQGRDAAMDIHEHLTAS